MIFGGRLTRRHVLRQHPAEQHVTAFAQEQAWDVVSMLPFDPETNSGYEVMWATPDTVTFHYGEDVVAGQSIFYLAGDDPEVAAGFERVVVEALDPWSLEELLDSAMDAAPGPDQSRAILRAGLGAPLAFDQRFGSLIESAITSNHAVLRKTGIVACSYSAWPEYRPFLAATAADDHDAEARELAGATLRAFDRHGVGEA